MSAPRPERVRIATRASRLALWQAGFVRDRLEGLGVAVELVEVQTLGDRDRRPFATIGGVGVFTKAVQEAVRDGRADVAVHSFKDLPSAPAPDLEVAAVPTRADARDVLVATPEALDPEHAPGALPLIPGARVGTGAVRRQRQLAALRPDLRVDDLRGNVTTRLRKLRDGAFDAIVLAAAGLARLGLRPEGLEVRPLDPEAFLPAPAQGALALEIRRGDEGLASLLTELHDVAGFRTVAAERGLMALIQGGCQLALGAHARDDDGTLTLRAWYEGRAATARHASPEGVATQAFDALGRPDAAARAATALEGP